MKVLVLHDSHDEENMPARGSLKGNETNLSRRPATVSCLRHSSEFALPRLATSRDAQLRRLNEQTLPRDFSFIFQLSSNPLHRTTSPKTGDSSRRSPRNDSHLSSVYPSVRRTVVRESSKNSLVELPVDDRLIVAICFVRFSRRRASRSQMNGN